MKQAPSDKPRRNSSGDPDLLPNYDFRGGVRGKYAAAYAEGSNVVVLAPDVAAVFPNAEAVNEALRTLVRLTRGEHPKRQSSAT